MNAPEGGFVDSSVLAPLREHDFRWLWIGQVVSVVGDKINQIAMAIMVYAVTGSMLQMGIMLGVTLLPAALFGLIAGVYVDRWDRRRTMLVADLARAAIVLSIPFVIRFGVGWAYALAFLASTVALFFVPAKRSLIPDIVPSNTLMAANSLDGATSAVAELAGLAAGGALVAIIGYRWAFAIDAATFAFSAACIAMIVYRRLPALAAEKDSHVLSEAADGLRSIWRSDVLRSLFGVYSATAVFGAASIAVCYALALVRYRAGAPGVALLDAGVTGGILIGSILVGRTGSAGAGAKVLAGVAGFGVAFVLAAFSANIWVAFAWLFLAGISNMFFFIPATTLYQTRSEESLRGRVMAAVTTVNGVAMVLGIVATGALAQRMPVPLLTGGVGVAALGVAAIGSTLTALRTA